MYFSINTQTQKTHLLNNPSSDISCQANTYLELYRIVTNILPSLKFNGSHLFTPESSHLLYTSIILRIQYYISTYLDCPTPESLCYTRECIEDEASNLPPFYSGYLELVFRVLDEVDEFSGWIDEIK